MTEKQKQAWMLATRRPGKKVPAKKYKTMSLTEYCTKRFAAGKVKPGRSAFVMMI